MDLSKFKPSDWLLVAAGAIMLIFGIVLDWAKVGSVSGNGPFDYFFTGGISWLLVVAAGVIAFLLATGTGGGPRDGLQPARGPGDGRLPRRGNVPPRPRDRGPGHLCPRRRHRARRLRTGRGDVDVPSRADPLGQPARHTRLTGRY